MRIEIRRTLTFAALIFCGLLTSQANAQVKFTWSEDASGVAMTASGSIDTAGFDSVACSGWSGFGHENGFNPSNSDIIGDVDLVPPDTCFGFSPGTDFSAWQGDAFTLNYFSYDSTSVTTTFYTYTRDSGTKPGLAVLATDLSGSIWTPQGGWAVAGQTFATMGLTVGTYTVTDAGSGASISFVIGEAATSAATAVPSLPLFGLLTLGGLLGLFGLRKLKQ